MKYDAFISYSTVARGFVAQAFRQQVHVWSLVDGHVAGVQPVGVFAVTARLALGGRRLVAIGAAPDTPSGFAAHVFDSTSAGWKHSTSIRLTGPPQAAAVSVDGSSLATAEPHHIVLYHLDRATPVWSEDTGDTRVWFNAAGDAVYSANGAVLTVRPADSGVAQFALELPNSSKPSSAPLALAARGEHITFAAGVFLHGTAAGEPMTIESSRWTLGVSGLVATACYEARRNLTAEEWRDFVGTVDRPRATCRGVKA